ncbi:hypothetical protein AB0M19_34925 [Streptomyces sp. NPDC051920]|uniref:hypothetical protein n=1 Tax=Streptomyces sp. NPDC051920 TaxID=3155523 RepID=UPI0034445014
MFVDSSGRRARLLSRIGMLVGVGCLGYAVVLGMAFMGWGTSLTPSSLLPFGGGAGSAPVGGRGGPLTGTVPSGAPTGAPPSGPLTGSAPSAAATTTAGASASSGSE